MTDIKSGEVTFSIGINRTARFIVDNGAIIGLAETHYDYQKRHPCGSTIFFGPEGDEWDLLVVEPTTCWPSIVCMNCESHGWIIEGRWVDESSPNFLKTLEIGKYLSGNTTDVTPPDDGHQGILEVP